MDRKEMLAGVDAEIEKKMVDLADLLTARSLLGKQFGEPMETASWISRMFSGVSGKGGIQVCMGPASENAPSGVWVEEVLDQAEKTTETFVESLSPDSTQASAPAPAVAKKRTYKPREKKAKVAPPAPLAPKKKSSGHK